MVSEALTQPSWSSSSRANSSSGLGLWHAGEPPPDRIPEIAAVILAAHAEGLAAKDHPATAAEIRDGFLSGLILRAGTSSGTSRSEAGIRSSR